MSEDVFRWVIAVAVILACIASISQAIILAVLFGAAKKAGKAGKEAQAKLEPLIGRFEPLIGRVESFLAASGKVLESTGQVLETSIKILQENRPRVAEIVADAVVVAKTTRQQAEHVSELIDEANARVKARITQIDQTVERTVNDVEQATNAVKGVVMKPVKEVNGIMAGVKAAMNTLTQGRHNSPDHVTQDEEMFI
jgi:ABC-type transporter Mla subunit MlaD